MTEPTRHVLESEINFRTLFYYATIGIVVVDNKGKIEMANQMTEQLFGYTNSELIGQSVDIFIPENLRKKHHHHRVGYSKEPKRRPMGLGMQLKDRQKDGTEFPVEISLGHYELGGEILTAAFITDIRKSKEIESELRNSEDRFKLAAKGASAGIWERDLITGAEWWSDKWYQLLGYEPNEFPSTYKNFEKLVHKEDLKAMREAIDAHINKHQPFSIEYRLKVSSGEYKWFLATGQALWNNKQEAIKMAGSIVDINDRKIAEQALHILNKELESKVIKRTEELFDSLERERVTSNLKSTFVSIASHEFRTPLTTVLSAANLIQKYNENEEYGKQERYISLIKSAVGNLTNILNDFLSLDKLNQNKTEIHREGFDLQDLLQVILDEMAGLRKVNQAINFNYKGEKKVLLNKNIIRNVILNLLSNSIKYSDRDIDINAEVDGTQIKIAVKDRGIGIPIEEQDKIFCEFFRACNTREIQGVGLGLNIVKRYIDLIGGTIEFTSKEGVGTTFTVLLHNE